VDSDTGWRRSTGESSGRWRILGGAGRARVPAGPEATDPQNPPAVPAQPSGTFPEVGSFPASGTYPTAAPQVEGQPYQAAQAYPSGQYPAAASYPAGQPAQGAQPYPGQAPTRPGYPAATPASYPGGASGTGYGTTGYPGSGYPVQAPSYPNAAPPASQAPYGPGYPPAPPGYSAAAAPPQQARPAALPPPSPTLPVAGHERAVQLLRRPISGSKVIAFANPKGGVHKTTATVLTAAAIGGARGGQGVLAWDDNELRGTLGLRAGSARHAKTIRHLLAELAEVELNTGPALASRIDDFLRHANDGSYDVLAGEEDPRFSWRLDPPTVRRVLDLLTRTHQIICVDTGNNVESGNWRTIMEAADQLVITTVPREDSAFSADWMMDVLVAGGREDLVANAVTLVSMTTPRPGPMHDDLVRHFRSRNRAVCVVPYDPVLEQGGWIDHTVLAPTTREAWLEAAAVIMEPLAASS
jgi:MinD-like ATPase involved in chromosome partitioning or flagellar assembly